MATDRPDFFGESSVALFPFLAIAASLFAWQFPVFFQPLQEFIPAGLGLIMLSMGLTLSWQNFRALKSRLNAVAASISLQFLVMPVSGFLIAKLYHLPPEFLTGMVLVGSVAGGTASNVLCYLAGGNVALSITMTACTTLIGCFLTPLLITLLTGQTIGLNTLAMALSLIKIVLFPVCSGVAINTLFHKQVRRFYPVFPALSAGVIILVIATVVAMNATVIAQTGLILLCAVASHNLIGLLLGYQTAKRLGHDAATCKTIAIEVGVQNSGLAVVLAHKFFSSTAALPAIYFSVWHNITGVGLASYWRRKSSTQ